MSKVVLTEAAKNAIRMTAERTGSNEINTGVAADARMPEDTMKVRPVAGRPGHWEVVVGNNFFRATFTKNTEKVWNRVPGTWTMTEIAQFIESVRPLIWEGLVN